MLRATAYARGRMKTLRDLQQGSDSDEEERPQEYYAGGEKSCVVLLNNESGGLLTVLNHIHPSRATPAIISGVAVQGGPSRGGLPDQVHNILNAAREYADARLERDAVRLGCLTPDHCAARTLKYC